MAWFKRVRNNLISTRGGSRGFAALQLGVDSAGKEIVVGPTATLDKDSNFTSGTPSNYGIGSIALGSPLRLVDGDGFWQAITSTAASPSASPSHSASPSSSRSPSASGSPSASASPSV